MPFKNIQTILLVFPRSHPRRSSCSSANKYPWREQEDIVVVYFLFPFGNFTNSIIYVRFYFDVYKTNVVNFEIKKSKTKSMSHRH